jgi:hypothetical protein
MICEYVRRSFANPSSLHVYYVERNNLSAEDRVALYNFQRATVEALVGQVAAAVSDIGTDEARFAVHAAFCLVVDLGRLMQYERKRPCQLV